MSDSLVPQIGRLGNIGLTTAPHVGTVVTAGAINTKGAWAALSTSTPHDAHGVTIAILTKSTGAADVLVDISLGGSGSEAGAIVVPNLLFPSGSTSSHLRAMFLPLRIPAGSRVSCRSQASTASVTTQVMMTLHQQSWDPLGCFDRFVSIGSLTATSGGTVLGNPAAAGWGAWTALGNAPEALGWVLPILGDNKVAARTTAQLWVWQAGFGAAGSEQVTSPELYCSSSSTSLSANFYPGWYCPVPNGQSVAMRYGSGATTTLGAAGVVIGGVK